MTKLGQTLYSSTAPVDASRYALSLLTTGVAARIAGVSIQTIIRWVDSRTVPGFRLPGSSHRRVVRDGLVAFLLEHKMPIRREIDRKTETHCLSIKPDIP